MQPISSFRSRAARAWDLVEKLRRLAAVRHAVVPNDANVPASDIFGSLETGRCPGVRSSCVVPEPEDDELARMIDALEHLDVDDAVAIGAEAESRRQRVHVYGDIASVARRELRNRRDLCPPDHGLVEPPLFDLRPFRRVAVAGDFADAQMIVLEYLEASFRLRAMVLTLRAPAHHRLFVAPGRQRKQATFRPFAFEPLVVDEAIHGLELRLEKLRKVEIVVPALLLGLDREDYSEHGLLLLFRTLGMTGSPRRRHRRGMQHSSIQRMAHRLQMRGIRRRSPGRWCIVRG